jgi:hypothetical protein
MMSSNLCKSKQRGNACDSGNHVYIWEVSGLKINIKIAAYPIRCEGLDMEHSMQPFSCCEILRSKQSRVNTMDCRRTYTNSEEGIQNYQREKESS